VPLIGVNDQPLDFYANAERREVFLPISSIKFMDDISIAFAYYDRNSCDVASISDYVAALRFHPRSPASSPLQALGVPSNAIKDSYVDDVAQKTLKSTIYFMAAHEFAHVMYRHAGYQGMTAADAQRHEMEADAFAIDVLRRVGVVPEGLTVLFLVASRLEAGPDDFSTPGDYERYLQQQSTHPTSARRIVAIADVINAHLADFARGQNNKAKAVSMLRADAARLRAMGETLDNVQMRRMLWRKAQSADMTSFRQACHH
jgi:hypothetical protein